MTIKDFHSVLHEFIKLSKFEDDISMEVDLEFALESIRHIYRETEEEKKQFDIVD